MACPPPRGLACGHDAVALVIEDGNDGGRESAFCQHYLPFGKEAGKIQSFLRAHAIDVAVHHHIDVAHGLKIAAHDAKAHVDLTILFCHGRNDGVERPLRGADAIGMADLRGEAPPAALQGNAGFRCYDAGAKVVVDGIDEGDGETVLVNHGEIDRIGGRQGNIGIGAAVHVDKACEPLRCFVAQEFANRHIGEIGIGDVAVAQDPCQFQSLDFKVAALG